MFTITGIRSGSHIGAMDATTAIEEGLCSILASDYYYPSLLKAASKLAAGNESKLAKYWNIISENPARASRLNDRGQLVVGKKADVLALSMQQEKPHIDAVFIDGKPVFVADISRTSG